jgi:ATP-dependent DNA helicase RecQ
MRRSIMSIASSSSLLGQVRKSPRHCGLGGSPLPNHSKQTTRSSGPYSGAEYVLRRAAPPIAAGVARPTALYQVPNLKNVDLSWAGRLRTGHLSLAAISAAKVGDPIHIVRDGPSWIMQDKQGQTLGRMARSWSPPGGLRFLRGEVGAIVRWRKSDNQEEFRVHLHRDVWEAVVPELVFG